MSYGKAHQKKDKVEVEVALVDGSIVRGYFFVSLARRVADLLNDANGFLPFEDASSTFRLLNKANIMHVKPAYQGPDRPIRKIAEGERGFNCIRPNLRATGREK